MDKIITQAIDGIKYKLAESYDFSFINDIGTVFEVFYEQYSGNMCFGIQKGNEKLFVKHAGSLTINHLVEPSYTKELLIRATDVYRKLNHSSLIKLLDSYHINDGYINIFKWAEGENLNRDSKSLPINRYKSLPLELRFKSYDTILDFHQHTINKGYIASDFYEGSIIYDFGKNVTTICDVDFYRESPIINHMGRMWGSSKFMSPEEFKLGDTIDEITNVYNLGAFAFFVFGSAREKNKSDWNASDYLYNVAQKAVNPDKGERHQTLAEFINAWNNAK